MRILLLEFNAYIIAATLLQKNELSPNQENGTFNQPRLPNSTNVHTHGLHISPVVSNCG